MLLLPAIRVLTVLTALASGFAAPAAELAHGVQHDREAAHSHADLHELEHAQSHDHESLPDGAAVDEIGAADHTHARLDRSANRASIANPVVPVEHKALPIAVVDQTDPFSEDVTSVLTCSTGPPPPSRAPPKS
jgi:hypothetical protein